MLISISPWSNVYGVARTVIALATALTLIANSSSVLFPLGVSCGGIASISFYCLFPDHSGATRGVAIFLLLVVASGWMPRITGGLHWWLTASFFLSASTIDGGDHLAGVLTLILVPLALTDPRSWHWQEPPVVQESFGWQVRALLGWSSLIVVRIQMAGVYLHTFVAKTAVDEWADGTALYYWFTDHNFGLPPFLMFFVEPLLLNGATVVALTWGSIFVEILLFLGIAASERVRVWLLGLGLTFHGMIAVGIGLWSFSTTMFGGLILYLWSPARTFNLERMVGSRWTKEGKAAVVRHGCRMRG